MDETAILYGGQVTLTFNEAEHAYRWNDMFVPGVTNILKLLDKPALVQWAANMAVQKIVEYIESDRNLKPLAVPDRTILDNLLSHVCPAAKTAHRRLSKSAADIGSTVHDFCEKNLTEQLVSIPDDPQARKGAEAFLQWKERHDIRPISCERMVLSRHWFFAGRCDFHGSIDGVLCILDFKTSSGLYLEMLLQLAAYAIALEEELGERINDAWIVRLDKKTGKCQPYHIPLKDSYRDAFLRVREAHELITRIEDELDGLRKQRAA